MPSSTVIVGTSYCLMFELSPDEALERCDPEAPACGADLVAQQKSCFVACIEESPGVLNVLTG